MRWLFDPLFTLNIKVFGFNSENIVLKDEISHFTEYFSLEPTPATAIRLNNFGWVFKSAPGTCTIYGEKNYAPNGLALLRAHPNQGEGLSFFLKVTNIAILNRIKPYASARSGSTPTALPSFSGRMRLLYLDNLNPVAQSGGEFSLTSDEINENHLASIAPPVFTFREARPGAQYLKFSTLSPIGGSTSIPIDQKTQTAFVQLPENTYQLEQQAGGEMETLILSTDMPVGKILGMVRIFEPPAGWEPVKRYRINFDTI